MEALKRQRGTEKGKITRIQTFLDERQQQANLETLEIRLEGLELAWKEYNRIYQEMVLLASDTEMQELEMDFADVEEKYYSLRIRFKELMKTLLNSSFSAPSLTSTADIKLPRIELPKFSGNLLEWSSFRDLFTSVIHNNKNLSNAQKLHYLKNTLLGEASGLLQSIEVTDANYTEAWDLLNDRYQNKRQLIQSHLKVLFGQPSIANENSTNLRKLIDNTVKHLRALNALGIETDHWDEIVVYLVTDKLDPESRRQWELSSPGKDYPKFSDLKNYIEQRCRALEASTNVKGKAYNQQQKLVNPNMQWKPTSTNHVTSSEHSSTCCICNGEHRIYQCTELTKLASNERTQLIRNNSLCFNCLRKGHSGKQCPSNSRCRQCGGKHHTLLHFGNKIPTQQLHTHAGSHAQANPEVIKTTTVTNVALSNTEINEVLLSTAVVGVRDHIGNVQQCRALLDSGSQASLISETCLQKLGLKRAKGMVTISGIGTSNSSTSRGMVNLNLQSKISNFSVSVNTLILNKLTNYSLGKWNNTGQCTHLANLQLADDGSDILREIEIILGADVFGDLLLPGNISGCSICPSAFNTQFGWVLIGSVRGNAKSNIVVNHASLDLSEQLRKFWEVEEIVPTKQHWSPEEQLCESHYSSSVRRDATGRFCVNLPLNNDEPNLGYSKEMAMKRLHQIERKLEHSHKYKKQYHSFMNEYLELNHMEVIPPEQVNEQLGKTNYLPHHFVVKPDSTTTELRVVFDASAKTSSGVSLNDKLLVGPRLQDDIWDIILRFRLHRYALVADITKMYRQIRVSEDDANLQRIVWRESPEFPIQEFRLTTLTYGTASAPYLAIKTLQELACKEGDKFLLAKQVVMRDFYVDDLMTGSQTIPEGLELQKQLTSMLELGGFQLRKWSSNNFTLVQSVAEELRAAPNSLNIDPEGSVKTLGLHWLPSSDQFAFQVKIDLDLVNFTKRRILSEIAKLYDPLGWLAPVVIRAKLFIQKLWTSGVSWDEQLSSSLEGDWLRFREQLLSLQDLAIDRCVVDESNSTYELHGFCDASEQAYAAVIYLRCKTSNGRIQINLLCAKTKVAPLKQISLPRLELCGALLLAKLVSKVQKTLIVQIESITLWTDSTVALAWITGLPRNWKTYVANRVSEIQNIVNSECWKHVPSSQNPADIASRGIMPVDLKINQLWWNGPSWLHLECENWPQREAVSHDNNNTVVKQEQRSVNLLSAGISTNWNLVYKFSSLIKLIRVTAWCLRWIGNIRAKRELRSRGFLTAHELQKALILCVKTVQSECFGETITQLQNNKSVDSQLASLSPFLDESGLIRVGGRIRHAKCHYDQKFPILLPKHHHLTTLVIWNYHIGQLHAGPQATLAAIRQKFWIVNGRSAVRYIIHKCQRCLRDRPTPFEQIMGDLPPHRVELTRPFLRCGVDFCGPFLVKTAKSRGTKVHKSYVALFVCMATKAVHLELVSDLTSDSFIAALKRFIARRGYPLDIYSDNGTNFVGADRELRRLLAQFKSEQSSGCIGDFLAPHGIKWHFIPAKAPHFGGLWEAGIKSTKTHLRRVVGQTTLTFEELSTTLALIESCLNSRPLCPISNDPHDLNALTPGHFLVGDTLTACPEPNLTPLRINRLSRWQLIQQLNQHFWQRWHREYLGQLQQRSKWKMKRNNIACGDLVLLKEDNAPPLTWIKGRVTKLHPGKDNFVRVVSVKTTSGEYKRPISQLCPLNVN